MSRHHALQCKYRTIHKLDWAHIPLSPPPHLTAPKVGLTRIQRKGLTFQNKVEKIVLTHCHKNPLLSHFHCASWIRFCDANGEGWAQPDWFVVVAPSRTIAPPHVHGHESQSPSVILLGECKLTQTPVAWSQMEELYKPLLEKIYPEHRIVRVQVVKNLSADDAIGPKEICWDFNQVLTRVHAGAVRILWCVER